MGAEGVINYREKRVKDVLKREYPQARPRVSYKVFRVFEV